MFEEIALAGLRKLTLSRREAEVLIWMARGNTNAQIAAALQIRTPTVKKHMERIFRKLRVNNRMAAAIAASERCAALEATEGAPPEGTHRDALDARRPPRRRRAG